MVFPIYENTCASEFGSPQLPLGQQIEQQKAEERDRKASFSHPDPSSAKTPKSKGKQEKTKSTGGYE